MDTKKIVMSGVRPTGFPHLGNWAGAFKNWVTLQQDYQCYYSIVDWHALTSDYQDTKNIGRDIRNVLLDMLGVGIDPGKSVVFLQSQIKEIAELFLLFSMFTPLGWLERVPTFKEQQKELKDKDLNTIGFLGYPLLQTIDIIIVRANIVPVGEDQVYHLELAREIVRRFNNLYGEFFAEPQEYLTPTPKLPGLDGRKMSKSYDNAINLSDSAAVVEQKIRPMKTDTRRMKRSDPGVPDDCPVFDFHKCFSSDEEKKEIIAGCTTAAIGCIDCKKILIKNLNNLLDPFRERRRKYENLPVEDILASGIRATREKAGETIAQVRQLMKV
ncbi:MAG: tryptophan--tRNA ligase [Candidatus Aminicenantes bacterium]|nr:tryptophan--tRNA ligase [Candidatus Aminicenantes bacterium]